MTHEIITALKLATRRIRADYRESLKRYKRLNRKSRNGYGLNLEESEQHDFEDGYSSALRLAITYLTNELSAVGVQL